jgi:hypothetical protein
MFGFRRFSNRTCMLCKSMAIETSNTRTIPITQIMPKSTPSFASSQWSDRPKNVFLPFRPSLKGRLGPVLCCCGDFRGEWMPEGEERVGKRVPLKPRFMFQMIVNFSQMVTALLGQLLVSLRPKQLRNHNAPVRRYAVGRVTRFIIAWRLALQTVSELFTLGPRRIRLFQCGLVSAATGLIKPCSTEKKCGPLDGKSWTTYRGPQIDDSMASIFKFSHMLFLESNLRLRSQMA